MNPTIILAATANPGVEPPMLGEPSWGWVIGLSAAVAVLFGGGLIAMTSGKLTVEGIIAGIVAGGLVAMFTWCNTAVENGFARRDAWQARVEKYLSTEYGVDVTAADVSALASGDSVVVTYDGEATTIMFSRAAGDKLAVLTAGGKPLEAVAR